MKACGEQEVGKDWRPTEAIGTGRELRVTKIRRPPSK